MSQARTAAGELLTDKQSSVVDVDHQSALCYFHPETEALVFVSEAEAAKLENHSNEMIRMVERLHSAQNVYQKMIELYAQASERPDVSKAEREDLGMQAAAAEDDAEAEREKVREALGDFSRSGKGYADVVELIPAKTRSGGGRAYAYVTRQYYDGATGENRLRNVNLRASDRQGARESFYRVDRHGRRSIDTNQLMKQISSLEVSRLKLELKDVLGWVGLEKTLEDLNKDVTLFEWAESWNESLGGENELTEHLDVSGGAQFMRFMSNVGASAEYDPKTGQVAFNGEGSANLTLASGKAALTGYYPDRVGWALTYKRANGEDFEMGHVRLSVAAQLQGYIGGSVVLGGQLQIVTKGDQQYLAGQTERRLPRFRERRNAGAAFYRQMNAEDEGLELSAQGFAGAQIEGGLKGALQWLKPADPPDADSGEKVARSSGEYVDFCTLAPSIAGLAGVGAGMNFHCTFINGKFCFRVAASLCWGVGAKGSLVFEVSTKEILEFGKWLAYQLYLLGYAFFELMEKEAFELYTKYCVVQMGDLKDDLYSSYVKLQADADDIKEDFKKFVKSVLNAPGDGVSDSKVRNVLAKNIVEKRKTLLGNTPETKAIFLYLLTRHGKWDDLDYENYGPYMDRHFQRKEAVICILKSIQTRSEWDKIMCRVSHDGSRRATSESTAQVVGRQEESLIEFLQMGFNRDDELLLRKMELENIRDGLKKKPTAGYALSMNDTAYYRLNNCHNTGFPARCTFGPYGEESLV